VTVVECGHVLLDFWFILHGLTLRNTGHKVPTYISTDQWLHTGSYGIATRWLRAALKLLLNCGLQPEAK
jgi:hypothetical protein